MLSVFQEEKKFRLAMNVAVLTGSPRFEHVPKCPFQFMPSWLVASPWIMVPAGFYPGGNTWARPGAWIEGFLDPLWNPSLLGAGAHPGFLHPLHSMSHAPPLPSHRPALPNVGRESGPQQYPRPLSITPLSPYQRPKKTRVPPTLPAAQLSCLCTDKVP